MKPRKKRRESYRFADKIEDGDIFRNWWTTEESDKYLCEVAAAWRRLIHSEATEEEPHSNTFRYDPQLHCNSERLSIQ